MQINGRPFRRQPRTQNLRRLLPIHFPQARQAQGLRAALDQARDMLDQMNNQSESLDEALKSLLAEMKADFALKQIHVRLENTLNRTPNPGHIRQLVELSRSLLRNAAGVSKNGSEVVLEVLPSEDFPGFAELRARLNP